VAKKRPQSDRRAVIDDIRKKQGRSERFRGYAIVGVCGIIALTIVGLAAFNPIRDSLQTQAFDDTPLQEIGDSPKDAQCTDTTTRKADGNQQHQDPSVQLTYSTAPPAYGPHWNQAGLAPAAMERKFYTAEDRPELESLVHNLEHGYNIVWYDETVAEDSGALNEIRAIADKFAGTQNFRYKFIAAPWTAADEKETFVKGKPETMFPEGKHIAVTHWSAGGDGVTQPEKQKGAFLYCAGVSGQAIKDFMKAYPYTDSPEPGAM